MLEVASVFPGRSYADLALSELVFYHEQEAFVLKTTSPEQFRQQIIAQSKGTILEALLDRRIANRYADEDGSGKNLSTIMRSNGTFVMYTRSEDFVTGSTAETLADGNWEIKEVNDASARLKVFGKFLDFSELEQYYEGSTEAELTRIFKDQISIEGNTIKGQKYLDAVRFR